ncbi:MAG: hemerythrin domain-containing protein [Proteobacteria bacterium]|nr:hemerythrin domain-containing protein [Pseudomonadota bacterium]
MTHALSAGVPAIPRGTWRDHPNFQTQTLLLGSHRNFRRVSQWLIERAEQGEASSLRWPFDRWKGAMHGHEHYEESKLYPFLARRFGIDLSVMQQGHEALQHAEEQVFAAFDSGHVAIEALRLHHDILIAHLELEEDHVIPCLLSLTAEEFEAYSRARVT